MFFESLKYFNIKDKFWLLYGSIADRIMLSVPRHIFMTRNFLEILKRGGYLVSGSASLFEITEKSGAKFILRRGSSDLMVFKQIFIDEEFKNVVSLIKHYDIKINRILDAGANIGLTSIYLKKYFPLAEVICVEPDNSNQRQLLINLNLNKIKNFKIVKGGVWSHNGWMDIDYSFRDGMEWSRSLMPAEQGEGAIPVYTIKDLLKRHNWEYIDLLKIDIEGAEKEVFGNVEDLSFLSRTKVVTIEVHDAFKMGGKIMEALQQFDFKIFFSGELMIGIKEI